MKRYFRRLILRRKLAPVNAHLNAIQREREMLDMSERHCVREANATQLALLNLDTKAPRHA
jgi:hypothetical protein